MIACRAEPPSTNSARHVVHISVDGLGGIFLKNYLDANPDDFPAFSRLKREGAWTVNARCDAQVSVTQPNHASMLTGRPVVQQPSGVPFNAPHGFTSDYDPGFPGTLHNTGNTNVPYKASVFDVVHDHGLTAAFYSGKQKFDMFIRSYNADNGAPDLIGEDNGRNKIDIHEIVDWVSIYMVLQNDVILADKVVAMLSTNAPAYTFLHFADPDITGHYYYWDTVAYRAATRNIDRQLTRVIAAIESNNALRGSTFILLTSDHGGGDEVGLHYNPNVPSVFTIPMFLWGPGVPPGMNLYELFFNRFDPGTNHPDYDDPRQPLRNGDTGNISLNLLGLPPIPGSCMLPRFKSLLTIERAGGGIVLSWPIASGIAGVEWAVSCGAKIWNVLTNGGHIETGLIKQQITNSSSQTPRFFRAAKPAGN